MSPTNSAPTLTAAFSCLLLLSTRSPRPQQTHPSPRSVVFEKYHKAFEPPMFDQAEAKIAASCKAVKAINPKTDCYIYTESDWARTEYSLGHWFEANPSVALQCPEAGQFVSTNDTLCDDWPPGPDSRNAPALGAAAGASSKGGCNGKLYSKKYLAYDFNNSEAREKWIERVTNVTATGWVDGAFIDGNRGGFNSGVTGSCPAAKRAGWAAGLQEATKTLAQRLGPNKTLISNYPTPDALALVTGGMMERGGSIASIEAFGKKTCGLYNQPCLLDYHAQYFHDPKDGKLAAFLLGEATVVLLKAVITAFPSVSLPFLAVPLRSHMTVAIRGAAVRVFRRRKRLGWDRPGGLRALA
eukprot:SAG22_NODE_193_length_15643_cov_5.339424_6_plen_355_part_00